MIRWRRLPNRTTPNSHVLKTEHAKIDGTDWWVGTIPPPTAMTNPGWLEQLPILRRRRKGEAPR